MSGINSYLLQSLVRCERMAMTTLSRACRFWRATQIDAELASEVERLTAKATITKQRLVREGIIAAE